MGGVTCRKIKGLMLPVASLVGFLVACGSTDSSNTLAGTYSANVFTVTPAGQAPINVLAAGGSLSITIAASNSTSGSLAIPASINGGTAFNADMAGTASVSGSTVHFQQSADTFVRDLTWSHAGTTLSVTNQTAGSASYTITLTRQ
jgi:hypothetical protein